MIASNSSVHNSNLHIFDVERYVGWGCILNCFMLSSLPCFYAVCSLLSLHLVTFLMIFILVYYVLRIGMGRQYSDVCVHIKAHEEHTHSRGSMAFTPNHHHLGKLVFHEMTGVHT